MPPIDFLQAARHVPTIGAPFEVFEFLPTVFFRCCCDARTKPMSFTGMNGAARCGRCGTVYTIASLAYSRADGKLQLNLGLDRGDLGGGHGAVGGTNETHGNGG